MTAHKHMPAKIPMRPTGREIATLTATGWSARCRVCGETLTGTLAALKAHVHTEEPDGQAPDPEPDAS